MDRTLSTRVAPNFGCTWHIIKKTETRVPTWETQQQQATETKQLQAATVVNDKAQEALAAAEAKAVGLVNKVFADQTSMLDIPYGEALSMLGGALYRSATSTSVDNVG